MAVSALLLLFYVPRNRFREANIISLLKQTITFLLEVLVVEKKLITYPFRRTLTSSFTFEYLVYLALCVLFNLYYPEKRNFVVKFLYYFVHTWFITGFEMIALKYTNIIRYKKWTWYWSYITVWLTYYISRSYHKWYMRKEVTKNTELSFK
ncbi:CBO0543 family protein [Niallia sp. XMNu-256]|uniref:CBO0543 family protein n=1 Tax=Niallia sp. XMNu-256 TaxID=3082444 RepID=UPI0030CF0874